MSSNKMVKKSSRNAHRNMVRSVQPQRMVRRVFLRGTLMGATISVGLPALDIMLDGHGVKLANGQALPRRFGVFHWGGGISHAHWVPTGTGTGWTPKASLTKLGGALKPFTTLITGFNHKGSSPGHIPARGIALSASHDLTVCTGSCVGTYRGQRMPEPSLDQLVAEKWSNVTKFPSLAVRVCNAGPYRGNSSWKRGGGTVAFEAEPTAAFNRVFGGALPDRGTSGGTTSTGPSVLEVTAPYQKSMLDVLGQEITSLKNKVGSVDQQRLQSHFDGIRDLEHRLQLELKEATMPAPAPVAGGAVCTKPTLGSSSSRSDKAKRHAEVLAYAMACDLTRIFCYEWSANQSMETYPEVGMNQEHHEYTHGNSGSETHGKVIGVVIDHFAYLGEQMLARKEGTTSVLENSLVFGTSEHANAGGHNYSDHPLLLIGKAGGAWKAAGTHIRKTGGDAPKVMLAAIKAVEPSFVRFGQTGRDANSVEPGLL